jgi:surfeit locus 1 family protein
MSKFPFRVKKLILAPTLLSTLTTLFLLPFLIYLGYWQLGRSIEKENLVKKLNIRKQSAALSYLDPVINTKVIPEDLQYRCLEITGEFIAQYHFLLDNQTVNKKVGYTVFTPFKLAKTNKWILINRGFIPIIGSRNIPPMINSLDDQITLKGLIHFPSHTFQLRDSAPEEIRGSSRTIDTARIIRMQTINLTEIERLIGQPFYPFVLRLEENTPAAFLTTPITFGTSSIRHLGYAAQWFIMALVLLIYFLVINTRYAETE